MAEQQKLRVLVIDDEVTQRMLVKEYLEEAGHTVRLSEDGKRGFKMATATNPDIILLDLMLPSIDGYSLCKSFKSTPATADTPVILITASREADVIEKGLAAGADDFLTKPVDWAFLADRVLNVVNKAKERVEMTRIIREAQAASAAPAAAVHAPAIDAQLEELTRNAEMMLEQAHETSRAERARLETEHAEALEHSIDELRAEFQAEFDTEIANRDVLHAEAISQAVNQARSEMAEQLANEKALQAQAIILAVKQARCEFESELGGRDQKLADSAQHLAQQLRTEFDAQLASLKAHHTEEVRSLRERFELDVETTRNAVEHDRVVAERRHAVELNGLRAALEASDTRNARSPAPAAIDTTAAKVQAAWSLALRSTAAQSVLASALVTKIGAAATSMGGSPELADLERTARSLNNLNASFKLLAQSLATPAVPKETPVNLQAMAADIAAQGQRIAQDRRVVVRCGDIPSSMGVMADEARLRYAWMSLVMNAVRYTPAGGSVDIVVTKDEDGAVRLGVEDNGVGIAPAKLRELLTCLDEANADQSVRPGESAGLGVPVATALARQMGGRIEMESHLGSGTQALIVFPAAKSSSFEFNQTAKAG